MEEDNLFSYASGEGYEDVDETYAVNRNKLSTIKSRSLPSFTTKALGSALLTVLHQPDANFHPFDDSTLIEEDLEWISNSSAFPEETFPDFLPKPVPAKQNSPESFLSSSSSASSSKSSIEALGIVKKKARSKRNSPQRLECSWRYSIGRLAKPPQTRGPRVVGRKCQHCGSEKTPQWRAGPHGAKTLCNACGVRFKSGRLVPEYRPANSPTFCTELHSNSHRKVTEMRRVKQMMGLAIAGPVHKVVD